MGNKTQLLRYKKLLRFLDTTFHEPIDPLQIENVCYYSYRNINRIFLALQNETIGQYIRRLKLEKAAEYLKYDDEKIVDIAYKVGYSDIAAFSKAFKKHFRCSPSKFRQTQEIKSELIERIVSSDYQKSKINYIVEVLPEFYMLYLTYYGSYENIKGIKKTWQSLFEYLMKKDLLREDSIFVAEMLDDNEITEVINCRYNAGIVLNSELNFEQEGLFDIKKMPAQKYAKFLHIGAHETSYDTYEKIYGRWMIDVQEQLADKPILEFYLNDEKSVPKEELITEIYIPIC